MRVLLEERHDRGIDPLPSRRLHRLPWGVAESGPQSEEVVVVRTALPQPHARANRTAHDLGRVDEYGLASRALVVGSRLEIAGEALELRRERAVMAAALLARRTSRRDPVHYRDHRGECGEEREAWV